MTIIGLTLSCFKPVCCYFSLGYIFFFLKKCYAALAMQNKLVCMFVLFLNLLNSSCESRPKTCRQHAKIIFLVVSIHYYRHLPNYDDLCLWWNFKRLHYIISNNSHIEGSSAAQEMQEGKSVWKYLNVQIFCLGEVLSTQGSWSAIRHWSSSN